MQEYFIEILQKVSFDRDLFLKELQKSRRWLNPEEYSIVLKWAYEHCKDKFETVEKSAGYVHINQVE